jgi:hypothetical protein
MQEKYYQVILKTGKTHKSLYKTIPNAIKHVGVSNIKEIKENSFIGLNNLKECSVFDEKFAEYYGFTETDIDHLLTKANKIKDKSAPSVLTKKLAY